LRDICIKLGLKNFDFHLRLSIELKEKWTQSFLERELLQYQREAPLKKVWVCGPPRMNEDLDKALEKIAPKLDLSRSQYEVL